MRTIQKDTTYRWDKDVLSYFEHYGTQYFSQLNIWQKRIDESWKDPRRTSQKLLHWYLFKTQALSQRAFPIGTAFRYFDKLIKWLLPNFFK